MLANVIRLWSNGLATAERLEMTPAQPQWFVLPRTALRLLAPSVYTCGVRANCTSRSRAVKELNCSCSGQIEIVQASNSNRLLRLVPPHLRAYICLLMRCFLAG